METRNKEEVVIKAIKELIKSSTKSVKSAEWLLENGIPYHQGKIYVPDSDLCRCISALCHDSKIAGWKLCYLVKWEGFGVEHNSWEPWDNIHAPECVADFHQRHPGAARYIRACDFNAIPFCSSSSSAVSGCHSLEGGVDVRGHPIPPWPLSVNMSCLEAFPSATFL